MLRADEEAIKRNIETYRLSSLLLPSHVFLVSVNGSDGVFEKVVASLKDDRSVLRLELGVLDLQRNGTSDGKILQLMLREECDGLKGRTTCSYRSRTSPHF